MGVWVCVSGWMRAIRAAWDTRQGIGKREGGRGFGSAYASGCVERRSGHTKEGSVPFDYRGKLLCIGCLYSFVPTFYRSMPGPRFPPSRIF